MGFLIIYLQMITSLSPGLVGVAGLVVEYYCKKKEKLTGPETRTCDEETQEWSPGEVEQSICKTVM